MLIRLFGVFVYLLKITSYFSRFHPMYYWLLHYGTAIWNREFKIFNAVRCIFYFIFLCFFFSDIFHSCMNLCAMHNHSTDLMEKRNRKTKIDFVHRSYIFRSEFWIERIIFHYSFLFISHWSLFCCHLARPDTFLFHYYCHDWRLKPVDTIELRMHRIEHSVHCALCIRLFHIPD